MAYIIKEYRCNDCGTVFESAEQDVVCPACTAEEPERVFLTAPGIKQPQTTRKDEIQRDLAKTYNLADMSNRDGGSVMQNRKPVPPEAQGQWGGSDVGQALAKLGANADGFSSVLPSLRQMGGPRTWTRTPERK